MITYSLLGWVFALFRIVASPVTAGTVKKAVESAAGTSNVDVHPDKKTVAFKIEEKDSFEKVKAAIERAGYGV